MYSTFTNSFTNWCSTFFIFDRFKVYIKYNKKLKLILSLEITIT